MNFKNLSLIFALLSLKVFANPIDDVVLSDLETLDVEVSDNDIATVKVEDSILEDEENSYSEVETEIPVIPEVPEVPVNSDLPCSNFESCAELMMIYKDFMISYGITGELLQQAISNYSDEKSEILKQKFDAINYGIKVDVNGHNMSVNIAGEQNSKTIVLLPALGIISPVIFYKDFVKSLSSDFKVITVEPFGYGASDYVEERRTNENIVSELHILLQKLGVDQFYLMAHSIGGIYSAAYANEYPEEVLGFIGLDNTPTSFDDYVPNIIPDMAMPLMKVLDHYHINAFLPDDFANQKIAEEELYQTFSEEDKAILRIIIDYKYINQNKIDENNLSGVNVAATKGLYFQCPLLMFTSTETENVMQEQLNASWKGLHDAMVTQPDTSDVIMVESTHGYIQAQQKDFISNKIKEWIN